MSDLSGIILGRYWPGKSPAHKLDPRTKIILTLIFIVIIFVADNFASLFVCFIALVLTIRVSKIPVGVVVKSIAPLLFIVVLTMIMNLFFVHGGATLFHAGPFTITEESVYRCFFMGFRLLILLCGAGLITLTTSVLDITEAFERLLKPLARIGFPAHEIAMMTGIALRFLPQFADEWTLIRSAQVSRGAPMDGSLRERVSSLPSLIVPLFASAFRHAETLALAMDARCYHGDEGRTRLHPLAFERRDLIAGFLAIPLLALVIAANLLF